MALVEVKIRIGDMSASHSVGHVEHLDVQDIRPVGFQWGTWCRKVAMIVRVDLSKEDQKKFMEPELEWVKNDMYDPLDPEHVYGPEFIQDISRHRKYKVDISQLPQVVKDKMIAIENVNFPGRYLDKDVLSDGKPLTGNRVVVVKPILK